MTILFFLAAFFAEVVGTMVGFGSSTVFLPLALLFVDFPTALTLVAFFHVFGNASRIGFFRHGLHWPLVLKFGVPSVIASLIGALLVSRIPQDTLKAILGLFLVLYAGVLFWKQQLVFRASTTNTIVGGGMSGFLAGLIGTGGALRSAFLTAFGLPKEQYIAVAAVTALMVDLTRIPVYVQQGFLDRSFWWYLLPLFGIALIGSWVGRKIVTRIPQDKFRIMVLAGLFVIGVKFIYDFFAAP